MKLVDFKHVAKQYVFLAEQGAGDEGSHGRVVHLCRIALGFNVTHSTNTLQQLIKAFSFHIQEKICVVSY